MKRLGVNLDHVATLRNVRGEAHPDILKVAKKAIKFGADSITVHLREDRRHINDLDLKKLIKNNIPINLEMAANDNMLKIALKVKPKFVCLVPENRKEITTEGGINIKKNFKKIKKVINILNKKNIRTSLFVEPNINDIALSKSIGSKCIEIHTGKISNKIKLKKKYYIELNKINKCSKYAKKIGLDVHAGHGIDYKTASVLSKIKYINEFNIGHFIIGESILLGLKNVIKKFKSITRK